MTAETERRPSPADVARESIARLLADPPQISPARRQRIAILLWGTQHAAAHQSEHH